MLFNLQPGQGLGGVGSELLGLGEGSWVARKLIYGARSVFTVFGGATVNSLVASAATFVAMARASLFNLTGEDSE